MESRARDLLGPVFGIGDRGAYAVPRAGAPTDLALDGNEGRAPRLDLASVLSGDPSELLRRYPDPRALEERLAARHGVAPERVVVTAGADDALLRLCTAVLGPGRELVLPVPTFEMIERYAALRGCAIREVPWVEGTYPVEDVCEQIGPSTALVAVVTPNNPTGAIATVADLERLSVVAPTAVLLVDLAYVEFADEDPTAAALELSNAVILRTFSKAQGLAGLRVGYAIAPPRIAGWLRQAGNPFPTSSLSLAIAGAALERPDPDQARFVETVRAEREALAATITRLGGAPVPSQANFVLARFSDPLRVRDALAGFGIAVRAFPGRRHLEDAVRITCPGEAASLRRVERALECALAPEAILFDVDGVLADVSRSYRAAIVETARSYGVSLEPAEISEAKREGNANDDWALTRELLARHGVEEPLDEVTERFERLYQGEGATPGLRERETCTVDRVFLERLRERVRLGIVTGRPRADARRFLEEQRIADLFEVCVCREDAPLKPSPAPLALARERLGVTRIWFVGDTVDDVRAARAAEALPLGVVAPGETASTVRPALLAAGAARVLDETSELEEWIR